MSGKRRELAPSTARFPFSRMNPTISAVMTTYSRLTPFLRNGRYATRSIVMPRTDVRPMVMTSVSANTSQLGAPANQEIRAVATKNAK